jgi:hypothetical protein
VEISTRDLVYIVSIFVGWGVSLSVVFSRFDRMVRNNSDEIKRLSQFTKRIVLDDSGQIRLVSVQQCQAQKKELKGEIDKGNANTEALKVAVEEISRNVLLIMYHLKIDKNNYK